MKTFSIISLTGLGLSRDVKGVSFLHDKKVYLTSALLKVYHTIMNSKSKSVFMVVGR